MSIDVVLSRTSLITQLLSDTASNTKNTILSCSAIVTATISQYSTLCANDVTILSSLNALSSLMLNGRSIPASTARDISHAVDKISAARGMLLGTGENTTVASSVLRFFTEKSYLSLATRKQYTCPQTTLEIFIRAPPTTATFSNNGNSTKRRLVSDSNGVEDNGGNGVIVTVSLSLSTVSYQSSNPPNSTAEKIQIYWDSYDSSVYSVTATVQNVLPVHYYDNPPSNFHVTCEPRGSPYLVPGNCTTEPDLQLHCPGNDSRVIRYTCPGRQLIPTCVAWNGTDYVVNSACTVVSYTAYNTSCRCVGSTNYDGSVSTNPQIDDLAASTDLVVYGFAETWSSAANITPNSFIENKVCLNSYIQ